MPLDSFGMWVPGLAGPASVNSAPEDYLFVQTNDVTIANSVAETTLLGTGVGSLTLPANTLLVGNVLRINISGRISTTGVGVINGRLRIKVGTVTVLDSGVMDLINLFGFTGAEFEIDCALVVRSIGAAGTVIGKLTYIVVDPTAANIVEGFPVINSDVVSLNTTIASAVDATWQWGTASPTFTITASIATVQ